MPETLHIKSGKNGPQIKKGIIKDINKLMKLILMLFKYCIIIQKFNFDLYNILFLKIRKILLKLTNNKISNYYLINMV